MAQIIAQSTRLETNNVFEEYLSTLSSPFDSFLEKYILESQFYSIKFNTSFMGYAVVFEKSLLTQFFIRDEFKSMSQELYIQVKKLAEIKNLFVSTGDEFLLSHAIESNRGFEMQAYFFSG